MKLPGVTLGILLLLGPALAEDAPAFAPTSGASVPLASGRVAVAWTPGAEVADSYRVYGLDGEARTLLAEHAATAPDAAGVAVDGAFPRYGVTGVLDGRESPITPAVMVGALGGPCIHVRLLPPPPGINVDCLSASVARDLETGWLIA